ncbi:MAG: 50S ribosomal protein L17 [Christensenellaceae bacterium]
MPRKLGMKTAHRMSVIKNQAAQLLWYGRIETTQAKAKELRPYVEKLITLAVNNYEDTVEVVVTKKDEKGKETKAKIIKDGVKKLAARRKIMASVHDIPDVKMPNETKSEYKMRVKGVNHPVIEKLFNELAPKYADRAKELGQGGGYTRIYLLGERRGDASEKAIIELV